MATKQVSILEAITTSATRRNTTSARLDCQLLLADVLNCNRSWLIAHGDDPLSDNQLKDFYGHIARWQQGEPVAYILGHQEFWSLPFQVNDAVLIPRPDTELLVQEVLNAHLGHPITLADLGTGSGAIAISLALERPQDTVYAVDRSLDAIKVAAQNRDTLKANNVHFCVGSWLDAFAPESLDCIVSNPPYIAANDKHLPDLEYEPLEALVSGTDGLDDIRLLVAQGLTYLKPGGVIAIEHGFDQQPQVGDLMLQAGYRNIAPGQDLAGQPRVTLAERP